MGGADVRRYNICSQTARVSQEDRQSLPSPRACRCTEIGYSRTLRSGSRRGVEKPDGPPSDKDAWDTRQLAAGKIHKVAAFASGGTASLLPVALQILRDLLLRLSRLKQRLIALFFLSATALQLILYLDTRSSHESRTSSIIM